MLQGRRCQEVAESFPYLRVCDSAPLRAPALAAQVKGAEGSKLGYVLMETDGAIGAFNRAQRGLQNFNEAFGLFIVMFLLASFAFPFAAFILACLFMASRVAAAVGYTASADGRMGGASLEQPEPTKTAFTSRRPRGRKGHGLALSRGSARVHFSCRKRQWA